MKLQSTFGDTTEHVLFDYNLAAGDTFLEYRLQTVGSRIDSAPIIEHVSIIDSTTIGGTWHRVWHMESLDNSNHFVGYDFIEGIGSYQGPFYPLNPYHFEGCSVLTCFHSNGSTPIVDPPVGGFNNSSSCTMSYGERVLETITLPVSAFVVPNPADETSVILLPDGLMIGTLKILDCMGRVVYETSYSNVGKLPLGEKMQRPGIYYFQIADKERNEAYSGTFVAH